MTPRAADKVAGAATLFERVSDPLPLLWERGRSEGYFWVQCAVVASTRQIQGPLMRGTSSREREAGECSAFIRVSSPYLSRSLGDKGVGSNLTSGLTRYSPLSA